MNINIQKHINIPYKQQNKTKQHEAKQHDKPPTTTSTSAMITKTNQHAARKHIQETQNATHNTDPN